MMSSLADNDLLLLLAENEGRKAFEALYNRYADKILFIAEKRTGNTEDALDIVQELFLSVWENRKTIQISGSFEAYLVVSVKYMAIRNQKKQSRRPHCREIISDDASITAETPFNKLLVNELQLFLASEIERMPEKMRQIYICSKYEELSGPEIASKLSISSQTVRNQISKAAQRIRKKFDEFF